MDRCRPGSTIDGAKYQFPGEIGYGYKSQLTAVKSKMGCGNREGDQEDGSWLGSFFMRWSGNMCESKIAIPKTSQEEDAGKADGVVEVIEMASLAVPKHNIP